MALSGAFLADFASFTDACAEAEVSLKGFESGSAKVEGQLNRMTDSLSGVRIVQQATMAAEAVDRIGGVSQLTEAELARVGAIATEAAAKLRAMGQDVPPGIQRIADSVKRVGTEASSSTGLLGGMANQLAGMFTVGALIGFGREVLAAGDHIQKMADQTALTTDEVQKLMFIAGQSGTSIESLVGAVQNLQQRLGDETSGAAGAMAKLGIQADAFNKLGTYAQMTTLASAIKDIKDPTEQASAASAIFGKTWKEILPAIKSGMKETGEQAAIMAKETVESLDRIGDAQTRAKQQAIAWGGSLVLAIEGAGFAFGDFLSKFNPEHFGTATSEILKLAGALNDPTGLAGAFASIKPPVLAVNEGLKALTISSADAKRIGDELTDSAKASSKAFEVEDAAAKKLAEEGLKEAQKSAQDWIDSMKSWDDLMGRIAFKTMTLQERLDTIDGKMAEWGTSLLKASVSASDVARATGLTTEQVEALTEAIQQNAAATSTNTDAQKRHNESLQRKAEDAEKAAAALKKLNHEMGGAFEVTFGNFGESLQGLGLGDSDVAEQLATEGYSFEEIVAILRGGRKGKPVGPRIPGYQFGIDDAPGGWSMVGEGGPEAMYVPQGASIFPYGSRHQPSEEDSARAAKLAADLEAELALANAAEAQLKLAREAFLRAKAMGASVAEVGTLAAAFLAAEATLKTELDKLKVMDPPHYVPPDTGIFPRGAGGGSPITVTVNVSGVMDARTQTELAQAVKRELQRDANTRRQFGAA